MQNVYKFLSDIRLNNNREWFAIHKSEFQQAQTEFFNFVETLLAQIATFDTSVSYLNVKDCTYRIYRDIRFSADKSPYKTHFGTFINPPYGKRHNTCGYYVHIEPGNSFVCAGTVCLESKVIKAIRQSIFDNIEEYRAIVESVEFRQCFDILGDNMLKTYPKGFPKDWEYIDYLRPRDFIAMHRLPDSFFQNRDAAKKLLPYMVQAKRFSDFINYTIEKFLPDYEQEDIPYIY